MARPRVNFFGASDCARLIRLGPAINWRVIEALEGMGSEGRCGGTTSAKVERALEEVAPAEE